MTALQTTMLDNLREAVLAQSECEHISVDAFTVLGLAVEERAASGNWRIATCVSDAPPAPSVEVIKGRKELTADLQITARRTKPGKTEA